ncbi:MAG: hypothetical protein PHP64_03575, partial [Actinomycetota bacterium]|nr:hypothetical protein [Actinomycetota bacterium]
SEKDPSWKVDSATRGSTILYFLFHLESGNWVIKDEGSALTRAELNFKGAPSDLYGEPLPATQWQAFVSYAKSKGFDSTGFSLLITRVSTLDPSWELAVARKSGQLDQTVVFHKVNTSWTVVAIAQSFTSDQLESLGVPSDLLYPPTESQAITSWIQSGSAPPGVTADSWTFGVAEVSRSDPSWEIVKGVQQGPAGTMYFVLHWENDAWAVKDTGGELTRQDLNALGMPGDIPY